MPIGYRCIVTALVGWLSLANAQNQTTQREQPKTEANQTNTSSPVLPPPANTVEPVGTPDLYLPCDHGQDARNSDLCAQWKAADAAREAADWTYWGVLLGFVGTIGLFWTLFYTRAAVKAAQAATQDADTALAIAARNAEAAAKTAEAASETNEIARVTQLAQLRPYMHITKVESGFHHLIGYEIIQDAFEFRVWVKNFGQTPAKNVKIDAAWALVECKSWTDKHSTDLLPVILGDMPPTHDAAGRFDAKGAKDIHAQIRDGQFAIEFRAVMTYSDGFGRNYSTHVKRYCAGPDYSNGVMFLSEKGNESD